jgi:erythromycin esterase
VHTARRSLVAAVVSFALAAAAQESPKPPPEGWWKSDATVIRSIDPADFDFTDLAPLKKAIGDSRLVVLGEESHGDGATFLAKVRLVEFLHREMGFDVLAWESGIADCRRVDERLGDASVPIADAVDGIFPNWSRAAQVRPLFEYVRATRKTARPVTTVGVDCQLSSNRSPETLSTALRRLVAKSTSAPLGDELLRWEPKLRAYHEGKRFASTPEQANETEKATDTEALCRDLGAVVAWLDAQRDALEAAASPVEVEWVRRSFVAADFQVRLTHASDPNGAIAGAAEIGAERDRLMGENLLFQVERACRGRKVVLWCASMHAAHRAAEIQSPVLTFIRPYAGIVTMGEIARRALGQAMYTIGFTAGRGSHGWYFAKQGTPLPPVLPDSIEARCAAAKQPFLFVDFRRLAPDDWLRRPQVMRPMGYNPMKAVWPDQMDGVFYVDKMFPASTDALAPTGYPLRSAAK